MKKIKATILAVRIEYHWLFVLQYKKKVHKILAKGAPLKSPKVLKLTKRLTYHSEIIMRYNAYYEEKYAPSLGGVL